MTRILTEDRIERIVERNMDKLDRQFMNGKLSREQYDREVMVINKWVNLQYVYLDNWRGIKTVRKRI